VGKYREEEQRGETGGRSMDKEEENEKRRKRKRNMRNVTLSLNIGA
jgi:hypothetical protein